MEDYDARDYRSINVMANHGIVELRRHESLSQATVNDIKTPITRGSVLLSGNRYSVEA